MRVNNGDYNSNPSYAHIVLQMLLTQLELSLNSPSFHPVFGRGFTLYITSFSGIHKVKKFCYISVFNAHGLTVIIVVVQVGAVKICVAAAVEALRKK
jgi:hypothetical protein